MPQHRDHDIHAERIFPVARETLFDAIDDRRTRLRWRMRFEDVAEAARVRTFVAEANEQNFDRLEAALGLPSSRAPHATPSLDIRGRR